MDESLVKVSGVSKTIKKQTLVEPIDLKIRRGEVLALCGGNGAGKSTILRMIAGILQPSTGEISVNGLAWKKDRAAFATQIGYMPDDYQFSAGLSAFEALSFWAALRSVPKQRVLDTLAMVGLESKKNNKVHTFSKGMRQRLLFAQSLLSNPPLLIMDEPTNGLDPYWMNEFVQLIKNIKQEGHAIIFSTHQLPVAEDVADHVVFLNEGRNCGEGSVEHYRARFGHHPLHAAFQEALR
ncbi:ABC transporter ATP-binding protein [Cohnella herbarum]|uniref:ABC transporter ATP-binding protein n=1 Tax=Cohnella herbarum TaxID=2728023 RepID=A0A7Z2ZL98_9BACL|nr:ABC transporter ATP-binding protein [Cohnella herbarum]QJD82822.1 ABC transporter ATP-binding protein [Cohnella herbarum]